MANNLGSMAFEPPNLIFLKAWMWASNLKAKMESIQNFFKHASSICCPLSFCREYKENNQGAACNNPTFIQCSSIPWRTDARGTKQNKMQNFASPSLAIAFSFMLGEFYQVSNSTTRASRCHDSTLLSYPSGLVCHEKNIKQKNKIKSKHKIKEI